MPTGRSNFSVDLFWKTQTKQTNKQKAVGISMLNEYIC